MLKDDEIQGVGNSYTAMFWQYDSRLGRRWNQDPVVKEFESSYASFANNPVWFIDPSGADSSLYNSNTGAFISKGITPEDDKTAIWTVDPTAKNYDKENPWKTAKKLTYSIGEKQKYSVGKDNLRKNHPLAGKGWTYGAQVYEEDLINMTTEFDNLVDKWKPYFNRKGKVWDKYEEKMAKYSFFNPELSVNALLSKKTDFVRLVGPDRPFDLKSRSRNNLDEIPTYSAISIGQYSFYRGRLMSYDDYGNAAYGAWGRAFGYNIGILTYSADLDQIIHSGNGDPRRDQFFVMFGFYCIK